MVPGGSLPRVAHCGDCLLGARAVDQLFFTFLPLRTKSEALTGKSSGTDSHEQHVWEPARPFAADLFVEGPHTPRAKFLGGPQDDPPLTTGQITEGPDPHAGQVC